MLTQLKNDYPDDLRVVYRHFPLLDIHKNAGVAMLAAEAAGVQGQFWPMHDLIFERQKEWSALDEQQFLVWLNEQVAGLGLDSEQFAADLEDEPLQDLPQQAYDFGLENGMPGTPFLLINHQPYGGPLDYANLSTIVRLYALQGRQFSNCPDMVLDPAIDYRATLTTEKGDIVIQLFADKAPLAVNSFVFLAREGWFDGVTFHRVLPGFVAQAGDPSGTGFGGPGYAFDNEIDPNLRFDRAGIVGMANAGPGSNGSQFFIIYSPQPDLDGKYTIFGDVIQGMDVVEALTARNPQTNPNLPPGDQIVRVTIEER